MIYLYAEVNIVGAVVLLLMLTSRNKGGFRNLPVDQQIFNGVMLLNLLIFIFDTGMWLVDGASLPGMKSVNYVVTTVYYLLSPVICFLWVMYTDFKIYENKSGMLKRARFYAIPVVVCTAMTLASPFTGWFFFIDEQNNYIRGSLFLIIVIIAIAYLLFSCGMPIMDILKNGWEESKGINLPLIGFPVVIIVAAVIQARFFGVSIIWVCAMLACTSIYINLQNMEISTDYLTGVYNRRRLDQHLHRKIRMRHGDRVLFAAVCDLDNFKKINDSYGHMEGDIALVITAELLRKSCKRGEDFIARLGGDEFIIVGERSSVAEIKLLIDNLNFNFEEYNKNSQLKYKLSLSIGYSVFGETDTADTFVAAADKNMYRCKQNGAADSK